MSSSFAKSLKALSDVRNQAEKQPMDFFKRGKQDSYVLLQTFLASSFDSRHQSPSKAPLTEHIGHIKNQLNNMKKLRQSRSVGRL